MSNTVVVHKGRNNTVDVNLFQDITGDVFSSEIRTEARLDSTLIAYWLVSVTDAEAGELSLHLGSTTTGYIRQNNGYMDIKRVTEDGSVEAIFDQPIRVVFRGTVTK